LYLGALLHDLGLLAIAALLPSAWNALANEQSGRWSVKDELKHVGATHSDLGAYVLALWGLPYVTLEIVAHHHDHRTAGRGPMTNMEAVNLAEAIQSEIDDLPGHDAALDEGYLAALGQDQNLVNWRHIRDSLAGVAS
jgi:HD-like signal output (HDOD) protein